MASLELSRPLTVPHRKGFSEGGGRTLLPDRLPCKKPSRTLSRYADQSPDRLAPSSHAAGLWLT